MSEKQSNFTAVEIRAGALVLVSLFILVLFVATVRGCRPKDETAKQFLATFTDIAGLNSGADVRFGGVRVGDVVSIEPDPEDRSAIRVAVEVAGNVPVNQGSVASIQQVSLTAEKHLEITTGDPDAALHSSGDTLASRTGSGGFVDIPDLEGLTKRLEVMLDSATALLGGTPVGGEVAKGEVDLADVAKSLQTTLDESTNTVRGVGLLFEENRRGIDEVITKLSALEDAATALMLQVNSVVSENREPLGATVNNLQQITQEAANRIEELAASLSSTLKHLEETGANASDLMDDQRLTIEEILTNLQETTRNLSRLSQTLADQPSSVIRGAKPTGRKNGEQE